MKQIRTEKKIDITGAPQLERQLLEAMEQGELQLEVDMGETQYISSVGLRVFVSVQKKLNKCGGSMILRNVTPRIMEIFEVTGFGGTLTIEQVED